MAKLKLKLPAAPALEASLQIELTRPSKDPARVLSLVGVVHWRRKERTFFRAQVTLSEDACGSTRRLRFPLEDGLPAARTTEVLSVTYWLISEIDGAESERWPVPFTTKKRDAPAVPVQLVARRRPDEPSIELGLRSSIVDTRIEGALAVQAPLVAPVRVELHQVLEWRPGSFAALREEKFVALSQLPVERLAVGKTCFFIISVPGGSPLSWTHADFRARWWLRVHADFGTSRWSFDVDVELSPRRDDGERSTKKIPYVGARRHRHELQRLESDELHMDGERLVGVFGNTRISFERGVTLGVVIEFPPIGVDMSAEDSHPRRCRGLLLAEDDAACVDASDRSLTLRFQPDSSRALGEAIASSCERARAMDESIAHLPALPQFEHALPAWRALNDLLVGSLSPAGLLLRAEVQHQRLRITPWGKGLQLEAGCAAEPADPRLRRFERQVGGRFPGALLQCHEGRITLFVGAEFALPSSALGPQEAAGLARELAGFVADFTRTGAYR